MIIAIATVLLLLHTIVASILLIRHAYRIANWQISPVKSVTGQLVASACAAALTAGFVALAHYVTSTFAIPGLIFGTPLVFLAFYWLALGRLLIYMSTFRGRRNLRSRLRNRIAYLTIMPTALICVGITAAPLILRAVTPSGAPAEKPIQEVSQLDDQEIAGSVAARTTVNIPALS